MRGVSYCQGCLEQTVFPSTLWRLTFSILHLPIQTNDLKSPQFSSSTSSLPYTSCLREEEYETRGKQFR
jgi:hypothetical protein